MEEIGPVDYAIIGFPGTEFRGEIAPAIGELVDAGTIRVIDIAFVGKDEDGNAVAMELLELDPDVQAALERLGVEVGGLFTEDDLMGVAEGLEPNSRRPSSSGRTCGRARSPRRCATQAASCRSSGSRTRSSRRRASWRSKTPRRRNERRFRRRGTGMGELRQRRSSRGRPARIATAGSGVGSDRRRTIRGWRRSRQPCACAAAPAEPDYAAELQKLALLRAGPHHPGGVRGEEEADPRNLTRGS